MARWVGLTCAATALAGCTTTEHWESKVASGFRTAGHTVSVLGVYRDGEMSGQAWESMRPRLEPRLGGARCPIVRNDPLAGVGGPVAAAVEEYTRANGPTDDLLAQLGPAAEGDLILVLVQAGNLPVLEKAPSVAAAANAPAQPQGGGGAGGGGPGGMGGQARAFSALPALRRGDRPRDVLQFSAYVFSVAEARSVALVNLQYTGEDEEEAARDFAARVGDLLPAATCKGWNWQADVDPEKIRKLASD